MTNGTELDPPWEFRQSYYTGVGQSISAWANMETTIVRIFAIVMRTSPDKAGLVLYSIMNFNTWLSIISELMAGDEKYEQFANGWNKKAERLRALNDTRVRLAHHTVWESDAKNFGVKPSKLDTRAKAKKYAALTMVELREFSEKEEAISLELDTLYDAMMAIDQPKLGLLAKLFEPLSDQPPSGSPPQQTPKEQ